MSGLLFVSQSMLDRWADEGRVGLLGDAVALFDPDGGGGFALEPAVRFVGLVGADVDPHGLLRAERTAAELRALGAERLDRSVLLGDVAYEVEPGYLVEAAALRAAAAPTGGATGARSFASHPLPGGLESKRKEAEALARFLLENLS